MKKPYSKPQILFEDFSLSTNIANCEATMEDMYVPGVGHVFVSGCDQNVDDGSGDGEYGGICYNNPSGGPNVHSS